MSEYTIAMGVCLKSENSGITFDRAITMGARLNLRLNLSVLFTVGVSLAPLLAQYIVKTPILRN